MGPATGLVAQLLLLAVLAATAGLGTAAEIIGAACAVAMATALARGLARSPDARLGPASWVTLARATLAVGVAALAADSFTNDTPVALLVTLAAGALALDLVDGWVARRTGTATALGARFDGEVDAFLILALSVYVAPSTVRGCSRSGPRATRSWPASAWRHGCARRCRGAAGAWWSRRRRASC